MIKNQKGFTLIELMLVIMLVGILAAMALGSYNHFVVRNAEAEVRSQMGQLEIQLQRWRASALTYRGFHPANGVTATDAIRYQYDDNGTNTFIYVPIGSNANNYRYQVFIFDGATNNTTLAPAANTVEVGAGRSWVMRAVPNPSHSAVSKGKVFVQRSTGMKCATPAFNASNLLASATDCTAAGLESW